MPNHIKNRITVATGDVKKYTEKKKRDDGSEYTEFDFNQFIPSPEELVQDGVNSNTETVARIALGLLSLRLSSWRDADALIANLKEGSAIRQLHNGPMAKDLSDEQFEIAIRMMRSYRACGHLSWNTWNREKWGTKWNSYEVNLLNYQTLTFETAWSPPHPVIAKMAEVFNGHLTHEWADEDTGSNVGVRVYKGGILFEETLLDRTNEGMKLGIELHGYEDRYRFNPETDSYEWVDDEDDD